MSNLTKAQYSELLFSPACSLITIEHLDVYHVLHWTPAQFFARVSRNVIMETPSGQTEPIMFVVMYGPNVSGFLISAQEMEEPFVIVSFRKAIEDRVGYAFITVRR